LHILAFFCPPPGRFFDVSGYAELSPKKRFEGALVFSCSRVQELHQESHPMEQTAIFSMEEEIPLESRFAVAVALQLLSESRKFADCSTGACWQFALERRLLVVRGSSPIALRWLAMKGFVEHKIEITSPGMTRRCFRKAALLSFEDRSCFLLTDKGLAFALTVAAAEGEFLGQPCSAEALPNGSVARRQEKPHWYCKLRQLWVGDVLVKEFHVSAMNQEIILAAFQRQKWRHCIDYPLLQSADPLKTLQNAVNRLNQRQCTQLLRFHTTNHGRTVTWNLL
jgi:hypothetical protein